MRKLGLLLILLVTLSFASIAVSADDLMNVIVYYKDRPSTLKYQSHGKIAWVASEEPTIRALAKDDLIESRRDFASVEGFTAKVTQEAYQEMLEDPDIEIGIAQTFTTMLAESVPQINADKVQNISINNIYFNGEGTTVCIVDTGINDTHPEIIGKVLDQKCFSSYDGCQGQSESDNAADENGHGTHVAGIIVGDNQILGVAPNTKLIIARVFGASNQGTETDILNGIDWCLENADTYNVTTISLSLGSLEVYGQNNCTTFCSGFSPFMNQANQRNISVVAATGNDGPLDPYDSAQFWGMSCPACLPNVTSVCSVGDGSGSTGKDEMSDFAHRDYSADLLAPGDPIYSSYNSGYLALSGTSQATPHVAGAISLIHQFHTLFFGFAPTPAEIESVLKSTGKLIYDNETATSFPRIDVLAALQSYLNDTTPPNVTLTYPNNQTLDLTSIPLNYTVTDNESTSFICSLVINGVNTQNDTVTVGNNSFTYTGEDGIINWSVSCSEYYLNTGYSENFTFIKDTSPPVITELNVTPNTWTNQDFTLNWAAEDITGTASYYYKFDSAPTSNTDGTQTTLTSLTYTENVTGNHTFYLWAQDTLSNINHSLAENKTFQFDDISPIITLSADGTSISNPLTSPNVDITYSMTDSMSAEELWYFIHNIRQPLGSLTGIETVTDLWPGKNTFLFQGNDTAGNIGEDDLSIYYLTTINATQYLYDMNQSDNIANILLTDEENQFIIHNDNESLSIDNTFDMLVELDIGYPASMLLDDFSGLSASWGYNLTINETNDELNQFLLSLGTTPQYILTFGVSDFLDNDDYTGNFTINTSDLPDYDFTQYCDITCQILEECGSDPCYTEAGDIITFSLPHFSSIVFSKDDIVADVNNFEPTGTLDDGSYVEMSFDVGENVTATYTLDGSDPIELNSGSPAMSFSTILNGSFMGNTLDYGILTDTTHSVTLYLTDNYSNTRTETFPFDVSDAGPPDLTLHPENITYYHPMNNDTARVPLNFTSDEYTNITYVLTGTSTVSGTLGTQTITNSSELDLKEGSYNITFNATDMFGNYIVTERTFSVASPDGFVELCRDEDEDGWGKRTEGNYLFCPYTTTYDCDDDDEDINPGEDESSIDDCEDNIDNDCDGDIDEEDEGCDTGEDTSSSDGGGGGGGAATTDEGPSDKKEQLFNEVEPGAWEDMKISSGSAFTKLEFKPNKKLQAIALRVYTYNSPPDGISSAFNAYQYFYVKPTNFNNDDLEEAKISFKVSRSWLEDNSIQAGDIRLYRYEDDKWVEKPTERDGSDTDSLKFVSELPGFSYFTVAGKQEQTAVAAATVEYEGPTQETLESVTAEPEEVEGSAENVISGNVVKEKEPFKMPKLSSTAWLWIILIFVIVGVGSYMVYEKRITPNDEPEFKNRDLSSKIKLKEQTAPSPKLQRYVDFQLSRGHTPDKIVEVLIGVGWREDLIKRAIQLSPAFAEIKARSPLDIIRKHDKTRLSNSQKTQPSQEKSQNQ